jgi:hypothetical protein
MVEVAEHTLMLRLRRQLRSAASVGETGGAARAVKALWREGSRKGAGRALVYDNANVISEAQTLREIAHPSLPLVLRWDAR